MEVGQSVVSTEEYIRLKKIQELYEKLQDGIEENVDKILIKHAYVFMQSFHDVPPPRFVGKDEALNMLQQQLDAERAKSADRPKAPTLSTTLGARIKFLFTGEASFVGVGE